MSTRSRIILLLVLTCSPAYAFQPGRFHPMDSLVLSGGKGPRGLEARDAQGKLLERAQFEYDERGRLTRENYFDAAGKPSGLTEYVRDGDHLKEEIRRDSQQRVLYRSIFFRDGAQISRIDVHDATGALELRRTYAYQRALLVGGEETVGQNTERFSARYDSAGRLTSIQFLGPDGKPYGQIEYRYSPDGRLLERERSQPEKRELCKYSYDGQGRINQFAYFGKQGDQWTLQKTLVLTFD